MKLAKKVPIALNPDFTDRVKTRARGFYNDNKPLIVRVTSIVIALLFIIYIAIQFYDSSVEKVTTVTALEQTVNESIFTQGYFVRQEQYIENSATGTVVPVATDGKKVSKGNTVAIAFGSDEVSLSCERALLLDDAFDMLDFRHKVFVLTSFAFKSLFFELEIG